MAEGSEIEYDPEFGIMVLNESGVSTEDIRTVLGNGKLPAEMASLTRWVNSTHSHGRVRGGGTIFNRDKYVTPSNIFDKFRMASEAVRADDIVGNVIDITEQIAFKRMTIECDDQDERNVWNQIIDDIDLVQRMREAWREVFTVSQCYPAIMFKTEDYKVKGKSDAGNKRKKSFSGLKVPIGITFLDPCKVVPIGNFMFNQDKLIYIADKSEAVRFNDTLAEANTSDLVVDQLILGPYRPKKDDTELQLIQDITGVSAVENRMFLLNPEQVWRITSTRPHYQRFADVRMESVFELLDLKHLLREMDRSMILGATNAIILVKKGDKDQPARPHELQQLAAQVQTTSRVPIIVGDHRIEIEIITPKTDKTLSPERYNGIDSRITARLFQVLSTGNYAAGTATDDSIKLLKIIAASMEARRDNIRDSFMTHIIKPTFKLNDKLTTDPSLRFWPRRISLDFDPNIATYLQDLRDRGDISRETILAEVDILEEEEAVKREREKEQYDEIFSPVNVPFSSPNPVDPADPNGQNQNQDQPTPNVRSPRGAGRRGGGNTGGGGQNPNSNRPS